MASGAAITPARSRPSARRCIDQNANREIFEEGVEVLFKAFEGKSFSHKGKYYTIPPEVPYRGYTLKEITLIPAPERLPVECWQPIQSGSERAFDFMAKYGISGVIGGGSAEGGAVERHMIGFQAAYARRGIKLELGERLALGYQFHIASSREQAIREAAPHYEENMKMFGELRLVRALTDEQIAAMRDPKLAGTVKLPTIEDAVKAGGFLAGRPEDIIEQLKAVEKRYPGARPGHLRDAARHSARCPARRPRPVRQGSDPGFPRRGSDAGGRRIAGSRNRHPRACGAARGNRRSIGPRFPLSRE